VKREKGKGAGNDFRDPFWPYIQLRAHARTKRNDFPVGLSPPTSDIYIYIYEGSKSDLWILAALRLQEFKTSVLISVPAVAQTLVTIYWASFPSPNKSRTELTPKFLDRSTPNSVSRLFHTQEIMEKNICKNTKEHIYKHLHTTNTHLHLTMITRSMEIDLGWCFWDARHDLWMPDGPNKPPDASIHVQTLRKGPCHPWGDLGYKNVPQKPYSYIYIYPVGYSRKILAIGTGDLQAGLAQGASRWRRPAESKHFP